MKKLFLVILCALFSIGMKASDKPGVIWYSTPVRPGEVVMVYGGEWWKTPQVELSGGKTIAPLQVNDTTISFIYPQDLAMGIVKCKIVSDGQSSREFTLNQPDTWWLQGDGEMKPHPAVGCVHSADACLSTTRPQYR
jgi:hypothetical protein